MQEKQSPVYGRESEHNLGAGNGIYPPAESDDCRDPFPDLMEATRHHRSLVQTRTKITNAIAGVTKRVAVDRIRAEGGKLPEGKMPTPSEEDEAVVFKFYPELFQCKAILDKAVKVDEKRIEVSVKELGILNDWIESTIGLGYKSIGYLLGLSGNPSKYPNYRMLVKQLGVAPRAEYYDKRYDKNLVPKQRRAITLYWCLDAVLKAQVRKINVGEPDQRYANVYLTEKRRQVALYPDDFKTAKWDETKATGATIGADRKARLRACTVLIKDLWEEWNEANRGDESEGLPGRTER